MVMHAMHIKCIVKPIKLTKYIRILIEYAFELRNFLC